MNRRDFITHSAAAVSLAGAQSSRAAESGRPIALRGADVPRAVGAYYLRAQTYTCVPAQVRQDMEWMAACGTRYVCPAFLEQDFEAAYENHALIIEEAARVRMQVLAVPSRWGNLTAGAPRVPSQFTFMNPDTWTVTKPGMRGPSGGPLSSVHHPKTMQFFCDALVRLYTQHPAIAGFILDEPKCFFADHSPAAIAALGENAPLAKHLAAAADFLGRVCAFAHEHWPDKLTLLFQQAHFTEQRPFAAGIRPLDYFGCDGRPWELPDDAKMQGLGPQQESGKGKVLLSGVGASFLAEARAMPGRKGLLLIENHNLTLPMLDVMERKLAAVLELQPDLAIYYYFPRNVQEPDRAMKIIAENVGQYARKK